MPRLTDIPIFWLFLAFLCFMFGIYMIFTSKKRSSGIFMPFFAETIFIWFARLKGKTYRRQIEKKFSENKNWTRDTSKYATRSAIWSFLLAIAMTIYALILLRK